MVGIVKVMEGLRGKLRTVGWFVASQITKQKPELPNITLGIQRICFGRCLVNAPRIPTGMGAESKPNMRATQPF